MSTNSRDPVFEITQSILTEAAQRPWLAALLMRRRPEWLTRLAHLAQRIRRLPQHTRRTLRRKLTSGLAAAALLLALAGPLPAVYAASITVDGDGAGVTCSLADAITSANTDAAVGNCPAGSGADTITLTADINLTTALPPITSDITIEGGGHTIQGDDTFRVLTVDSGGSLALNEATITVQQALRFKHNRATTNASRPDRDRSHPDRDHGKPERDHGKPVRDATTITASRPDRSRSKPARDGGRLNRPATSSSGGISNAGTLTVTNSTITGHTSAYGAGIFNDGDATVVSSTISANYAYSVGGGLFNYDGAMTVENSAISDNVAYDDGGGLWNSGVLTLTNSTTINNNLAYSDGGGLYSDGGSVTVQDSTITSNIAYSDGGGLYTDNGTVTVSNTTISNNTADSDGGGLYVYDGTATVEDSTISANAAADEGGGIYLYDGNLTVSNTTLSENTADNDGGGLSIYAGIATVEDSTISINTAYDGGGLLNRYGDVTVQDTTLSDNSANNQGGGLFNSWFGNMLVTRSTLSGNTAIDGGGIFNATNDSIYGNLTVNDSTIDGNKATYGDGGGLHNEGDLTLTGSTFSGNTAYYPSGGHLKLTGTTISGNLAVDRGQRSARGNGRNAPNHYSSGDGGGLFNSHTASVQNSTFNGNTASDDGGGLFNDTGTLTVTNSTLSGNTAFHGGGVANYAGTLTLRSSTVTGNSGTSSGGGLRNTTGEVGAGVANVQYTIIAEQAAGADCVNSTYSTLNSLGYNIESATSCGLTSTGDLQNVSSLQLNLDPTLSNNGTLPHPETHALITGSVAIDLIPLNTGGCGDVITVDERGAQRAGGSATNGGTACDVGAYEYSQQTPTAITLRNLSATAHDPVSVGAIFAALAALITSGAVWARRRTQKTTAEH